MQKEGVCRFSGASKSSPLHHLLWPPATCMWHCNTLQPVHPQHVQGLCVVVCKDIGYSHSISRDFVQYALYCVEGLRTVCSETLCSSTKRYTVYPQYMYTTQYTKLLCCTEHILQNTCSTLQDSFTQTSNVTWTLCSSSHTILVNMREITQK